MIDLDDGENQTENHRIKEENEGEGSFDEDQTDKEVL